MAHEFIPLTHLHHLQTGDVVRGKLSGKVYVVTGNYGDRVTAVQTADITNPPEWEVLRPAHPTDAPPKRSHQRRQPFHSAHCVCADCEKDNAEDRRRAQPQSATQEKE